MIARKEMVGAAVFVVCGGWETTDKYFDETLYYSSRTLSICLSLKPTIRA